MDVNFISLLSDFELRRRLEQRAVPNQMVEYIVRHRDDDDTLDMLAELLT